jgi:hypothetical protein
MEKYCGRINISELYLRVPKKKSNGGIFTELFGPNTLKNYRNARDLREQYDKTMTEINTDYATDSSTSGSTSDNSS